MLRKLTTNMESVTASTATRPSSARPVDRPLGWIGSDRLLLDDTSAYGLRRYVVARKAEPPDVDAHMQVIEGSTQSPVYAWCVLKDDGYWYLWICWKERP